MQPAQSLVLQGVVGAGATLRPRRSTSPLWPPESNSKDGAVGETFRGTGITMDEAAQLVSKTKARLKQDGTCSTGT